MTPERIDLKAMKEAAEKATPGKRTVINKRHGQNYINGAAIVVAGGVVVYRVSNEADKPITQKHGDAEIATMLDRETILALVAVVEAAREIDTFAWSALTPDCQEAGDEAMRRINAVRAALHPFTEST